jgi:hypothetical protein
LVGVLLTQGISDPQNIESDETESVTAGQAGNIPISGISSEGEQNVNNYEIWTVFKPCGA